jgi:tRNA(fMet)-specific endonuclease VapC
VILDTNALSAWAEGSAAIRPLLSSAEKLVVPSVVLGEFDFGIRQSRHYRAMLSGWRKACATQRLRSSIKKRPGFMEKFV